MILTRDNSRLLALQEAYAQLNLFKHSFWQDWERQIDLANFRGEGHYMAQLAEGHTEQHYENTFDYVRAHDEDYYLAQLTEDKAFGCITFERDGFVYSRDLLDSILEIQFVKKMLGDLPPRWLDIGAGYGRLAHRLTELRNDVSVTCVDAVATSTFVCEVYSTFRGFDDQCYIAPLTELDTIEPPDIAVNIHSWSECTLSAINFWLDRLSDWKVRYLFIVPHDQNFRCCECDGSKPSFLPALKAHDYQLLTMQSKYDRVGMFLYPTTYLLLEHKS